MPKAETPIKLVPSDEYLEILVMDQEGPGGAHHHYEIRRKDGSRWMDKFLSAVKFQKGGIAEVGVNGVTNEALLSIVAHRLTCFQDGPFRCQENESALFSVCNALDKLQRRTESRKARGAEGKQVA